MTDIPPYQWLPQVKKAIDLIERGRNQEDAGLQKLLTVLLSMMKAAGFKMAEPEKGPEKP